MERRDRRLVAGGDKGIEGLQPFSHGGVTIGQPLTQQGIHPRVAEPHRDHTRKPPHHLVVVRHHRIVALLPGPRGGHPSAGGEGDGHFFEHPRARRRIGGRERGHDGLGRGLVGGRAADDETRHHRNPAPTGQGQRLGRIHGHERLDRIPVHQRQVVVAGILGMRHERRGDRPAGVERQPLERGAEGEPHHRRRVVGRQRTVAEEQVR